MSTLSEVAPIGSQQTNETANHWSRHFRPTFWRGYAALVRGKTQSTNPYRATADLSTGARGSNTYYRAWAAGHHAAALDGY